jgi:hypothetical protein
VNKKTGRITRAGKRTTAAEVQAKRSWVAFVCCIHTFLVALLLQVLKKGSEVLVFNCHDRTIGKAGDPRPVRCLCVQFTKESSGFIPHLDIMHDHGLSAFMEAYKESDDHGNDDDDDNHDHEDNQDNKEEATECLDGEAQEDGIDVQEQQDPLHEEMGDMQEMDADPAQAEQNQDDDDDMDICSDAADDINIEEVPEATCAEAGAQHTDAIPAACSCFVFLFNVQVNQDPDLPQHHKHLRADFRATQTWQKLASQSVSVSVSVIIYAQHCVVLPECVQLCLSASSCCLEEQLNSLNNICAPRIASI